MFRVNIKTLEFAREALPANLKGLSVSTLQNLQTELNPVPVDLVDIEYWPENTIAPVYDPATEQLGPELLVPDFDNKVVNVETTVSPYTPEVISSTFMYPDQFLARLSNEEYAKAPERLKTTLLAAAGRKIDISDDRIKEGLESFLDADRAAELMAPLAE